MGDDDSSGRAGPGTQGVNEFLSGNGQWVFTAIAGLLGVWFLITAVAR